MALFGELLNIREHYTFASQELPATLGSAESDLSIKMSKYGSLAFFKENVARLGFLSDQDIADLMQLSLVIRNNDIQLDYFSQFDPAKALQSAYSEAVLRQRMGYTLSLNDKLLTSLAKRNPSIRPLLEQAPRA